MKFLTRVVLPIAFVLGLIAAVTFVSHYVGNAPRTTGPAPLVATEPKPAGDFGLEPLLGDWKDLEERDHELGREGQHLFWFRQRSLTPALLGLESRSGLCARVEIDWLGHEEWAALAAKTAAAAGDLVGNGNVGLGGASGLVSLNAAWSDAVLKRNWLTMEKGDKVSVPSWLTGVLRLTWIGYQPGSERAAAQFWTESRTSRGTQRLEVPLALVPALQVAPLAAQVPQLSRDGQRATVEFRCWSSTRASFPLQARGEQADPCIGYSWQPLDAAELEALRRSQETRARAGYRVTVTVYERRSETELLEFGPLERTIVFAGPKETPPAFAHLSGFVRGPVRVGAPDERVNLGSFKARLGTSRTVPLTTEGPDLELAVASQVPPYLEVALERGGSKRWDLRVQVPPSAAQGRLPPESAVTLQLKGKTERRLRIPIIGQATQ